MGLDIYLYERVQAERNDAYDAACEALYTPGPDGKSPRDRMSDDEYKTWSREHDTYTPSRAVPSESYPDHLFNQRYLRSSYNDSGFNRAVPDITGQDHGLYWIFEPLGRDWREGDDGWLRVKDVDALWECRVRARQVAAELREAEAPLRASDVSILPGPQDHLWSEPPTAEQALEWYREQRKRESSFTSYSCAKGAVFSDGFEIVAATVGRDVLGQPAAILIYRLDKETLESYVQAAEITAEFCDEAIALIVRDGACRMSWSG